MSAAKRLKRLLPRAIGANLERATETYLRGHGLETLSRNYRCRRGEIDLIMRDRDTIVFVEVRYRANAEFGDPLETITASKQRRIIAAATHFLAGEPGFKHSPCRFDAVGVTGTGDTAGYDWIRDAFST